MSELPAAPTLDPATERHRAFASYNQVWTYLDRPDRPVDGDHQVVLADRATVPLP